jgi:hypothetical protein
MPAGKEKNQSCIEQTIELALAWSKTRRRGGKKSYIKAYGIAAIRS